MTGDWPARISQMDSRVQDYLDDQIQSVADLDSLDALLKNVKAQHNLLNQQLEDARREHESARRKADETSEVVRKRADSFRNEQAKIDQTLLSMTDTESIEDAVQTFEKCMSKLRNIDIATGYVELLSTIEQLRNNCVSQLSISQDTALKSYRELQQLVVTLLPLQIAADGAAPHLLGHIAANVQDLHVTLRKAFSERLEKTLTKMNWPKQLNSVPLALQAEWASNVGRLLDLQRSDLEVRKHDRTQESSKDVSVLVPFEALVLPLEQRFSYHFSGNKPTNRPDKPEIFLNHVLELITKHAGFVQNAMQPVLLRHFGGSDLAFVPAYIDALAALITALIPMLEHKLSQIANQISDQPALLSHLVQEVISFDNTLLDSYAYAPMSASTPWPGLSYYLLETCGFFPKWLSTERDFALARYSAIIESPEAGEIDYDSVESDATKPTKAAIRLNDLLETITERYRYLNSYSQKIRFLIDIQIEIFDRYFQRLRTGLEAYRNLTSTVGRTINNVSKADVAEVQGIRGLDRLCRIFGAADYLERAMRDWSDDIFFLELWAELEYRAKNHGAVPDGAMGSWHEIQQKTSSALNSEQTPNGNGASTLLQGALFDETAGKYRSLRMRSESALVEALTSSTKQALKPYTTITTWASLSSSSSSSGRPSSSSGTAAAAAVAAPTVSAELDSLISYLTDSLGFLRRAVGKAPLRRLVRSVCYTIQAFIWDNVLTAFKVSFSTAGAAQLTADLRAICAYVDRYAGPGQAQIGMWRLLEGVTLLSLPVRGVGEGRRTSAGARAGEGRGEDEDDDNAWDLEGREGEEMGRNEGSVDVGAGGASGMSLFQAERLVFMDNESARHALEQLGLTTLSEADARAVLGKRVEVGS